MKSAETNIYIDEASLDFYEKLDFFHEHFIDKMLMCGVSNNGTHVEEIPFTKCAREYNYDFYKALVFLVQKFQPFCISKLTNKKRLELECMFFDFSEPGFSDNVYMIQNVMDWTSKNNFSCQFWKVKDNIKPDMILEFWL